MEKKDGKKRSCADQRDPLRETHRSVKEPVEQARTKRSGQEVCETGGDEPRSLSVCVFCNRIQALEILQQAYACCGLISCCQQHKVGLKPSMVITRYSHSVGTLGVISRRNSEGGWMKKGGVDFGIRGPVIQTSVLKTMLRSLEVITLCLFKGSDRSFFFFFAQKPCHSCWWQRSKTKSLVAVLYFFAWSSKRWTLGK